jgi:hypothetical protein
MKYLLIAAFLAGCTTYELSPQSHHRGVSKDAPIVGHDDPVRGTQMDVEMYPEGYES